MSWLQKLLPPKIKRAEGVRRSVPEGLWCKCPACEAVLYSTDLESNLSVCPKCGHHHRISARIRLDLLLDAEGRYVQCDFESHTLVSVYKPSGSSGE